MTESIETERLILRKYVDEDICDIWEMLRLNKKLLKGILLAGDDKINSLDETLEYIKRRSVGWLLRSVITFGIWLKSNGKLVGEIILFHIDWSRRRLELGYYISSQFHNLGIATEAVAACIRFVFDKLPIDTIVASCSFENRASMRVIDKCGFTKHHEANQCLFFYVARDKRSKVIE